MSVIKDKIEEYLNKKNSWDKDRVKEILDYYIPRCAEWDDEIKEFYFFDNGCGWHISYAKKHLKRKDRRFWKNNACFGGCDIRRYLIEEFELEGFEKEVLNYYDGWTELAFKMKNSD